MGNLEVLNLINDMVFLFLSAIDSIKIDVTCFYLYLTH